MEQIFTVTHGTSGHYKAFWCYFAGVTELKRERWICQLLLLSQSSYTLFKQLIDQDFVWYFAYRCFYSVSAYLFMQKLIVSEHNIYCTEKKKWFNALHKKRTKAKVCIIHNKFCWAFVQVHSTKNPPLCLIVLLKCLLYSHGSVCLITQMRIIKSFLFFFNFILLSAFSHEVMMLRIMLPEAGSHMVCWWVKVKGNMNKSLPNYFWHISLIIINKLWEVLRDLAASTSLSGVLFIIYNVRYHFFSSTN